MGLGTAVEASRRGIKTLLLEARDFASGTSSRSSKMIHGGLRYLKQLDIPMVRQSLQERSHLLRTASKWVKEQRILIPLYNHYDIAVYRIGLTIYDRLARSHNFTPSEFLDVKQTLTILPKLNSQGLKGAVVYSDALFDDARLALVLARVADKLGATVINYMPVVSLLKEGKNAVGVVVEDKQGEGKYELRTDKIINAAGTFADSIIAMDESQKQPKQVISQGSHIVVPYGKFPSSTGMLVPQTADGRVMFCLPWYGHILIGTTDIEVDKADTEPKPQDSEIDFILENCRPYFPIDKGEILSCFAGQRALVSGKASSKELSRTHKIFRAESGMTSILGGKWTTYRVVAKDAVDHVFGKDDKKAQDVILDEMLEENDYSKSVQSSRIHPDLPYSGEQILGYLRTEMPCTIEDMLARRTRALFLNSKAAVESSEKIAAIMEKEMNKSPAWKEQELRRFNLSAQNYLVPNL